MDKQNVVYLHNGIWFGHRKEWNLIYATTWVNLKDYAEWNKPTQNENIVWFHLYEVSRIGKFIATESRQEITRGQGERTIGS